MKVISQSYFRNQYIREIIDNFNWERIHKVMVFLQWKYLNEEIPEIDDLKLLSKNLLDNIWLSTTKQQNETWSIKSGGFKATASYNSNKKRIDFLKLEFILSDYYKEENDEG